MAMSGKKLAGWLNLVVSTALALAVWVLATVLSTQPALKRLWDFSPQARFSVGASTELLLEQLRDNDETLEIHTLYYPLSTVQVTTAEQRQSLGIQQRLQDLTTDLLRQYDYLGGDAVRVTHQDLLRKPGDVREVLREIQQGHYNSVIIKMGKRSKVLSLDVDMAEFDTPHSTTPQGMPAGTQRLPILKDYKGEEALSTAIRKLLDEGSPKVYFLSGYSAMATTGIGASYSSMLTALGEEGFEIGFWDLEKDGQIPDDAAVVCLINPTRELSEGATEQLYQYVRRGGRLFVNLHYYMQPADWNVSLRGLGERLGFSLSSEMVCHVIPDPSNPNKSTTGDPMCQNLVAVDLNQVHPVTRPLLRQGRYPQFKLGREIRGSDGNAPEGVRVQTYFLRTGPGAWLETPADNLPGGPPLPLGEVDWIGPPTQDGYQPRSIGAIVDVDATDGKNTGHVVLIAAEGFSNLGFQVNGDFLLNLFNWMTERDALISVRGTKYVSRKLELAPQQVERIGWLLIAGVPGLMFMLGLFVFWRRSRT